MAELVLRPAIPAMSEAAIARVRAFEIQALGHPQVAIATDHAIHGGMYARTVMVPAGVVLTGALIKLATLLIVSGDADVYVGGAALEARGYCVLPASAGRKQLIIARTDVRLTMIFRSDAKTVDEAERQFTDEAELLFSRHGDNRVTITGE